MRTLGRCLGRGPLRARSGSPCTPWQARPRPPSRSRYIPVCVFWEEPIQGSPTALCDAVVWRALRALVLCLPPVPGGVCVHHVAVACARQTPQGKSSSEQRGHRELWLHHRLQGRQRGRGRRGSAPAVRCYLPCVAARFQLSATPACTSLLQPARNLSPGLRRQNLRVQTPMRNARVHDEICAPL